MMTFDQWWELQWLDDPSPLAKAQMEQAWNAAQDYADDKYLPFLPYSYYMDPPDGGNVSIYDQIGRMAEDAALWRAHIRAKASS